MSGVYYSPGDYGLTQVAELDDSEPYSFDMVVLWRDHRGDLWAAHDSGCSCPTPFEGHKFPADFTQVRTVDDIRPLLDDITTSYSGPSATAVFDFLAKVREAVAT